MKSLLEPLWGNDNHDQNLISLHDETLQVCCCCKNGLKVVLSKRELELFWGGLKTNENLGRGVIEKWFFLGTRKKAITNLYYKQKRRKKNSFCDSVLVHQPQWLRSMFPKVRGRLSSQGGLELLWGWSKSNELLFKYFIYFDVIVFLLYHEKRFVRITLFSNVQWSFDSGGQKWGGTIVHLQYKGCGAKKVWEPVTNDRW